MSPSIQPVWARSRRSFFFYLTCAFVLVAVLFAFSGTFPRRLAEPESHPKPASSKPYWNQGTTTWRFDPARDARNLGLSDEQCDIAFPDLYTEVYRARDHLGLNSVKQIQVQIYSERKPWAHAQIHVLIHSGQLYIVDEMKGASNRARALAGLANLYRAITALDDPSTIPNVEFILDLEDTPTLDAPKDRIVWGWNRPKSNLNTWVAPDFDGWAFPNPDLGSYISFRDRIQYTEQPFVTKIPKAVWRGANNNQVREALLSVVEASEAHQSSSLSSSTSAQSTGSGSSSSTLDESWADVRKMSEHRMHMAEFCKYMFPIHTEGVAWSGRLRYLQNCESVPIIHQPLQHQAHYYDLLAADGPHQNYIAVRNDFADLEEKVKFYLDRPELAARIARNSVATFRDRYLTPAAEACYWRRMIRSWSEVQAWEPEKYVDVMQHDGSVWKKQRGVDWEIFAATDPHYVLDFPGYGNGEGKEGKEE
ncbi:uncharacterized protein BKCO1_4100042 [Diplodia corticola]|uniref:Glycosyl transferase CAP10 domain-containing protein n=1 Tax=Diplodia corticola TaxID=236234 RepID=A0A1J9QUK4_9PEZI|nr:uncharacterized protein BKCO1_4100042 [Diplodia corticola]OJD32120.1 hypothetical protein BKCO1_4100042 [Diplodia corticola]